MRRFRPRTVRPRPAGRPRHDWMLTCDTHGRVVWEHHVCCEKCERVYQTADRAAENYAPEVCACGARLQPTDDPAGEYSAAPICPQCYSARLRATRGAA